MSKFSAAQVVCAGEALIDLIEQPSGCMQPCLGGSVYNMARALALQGISTSYLNPLSSDKFGTDLFNGLTQSGVHVASALRCDEPSSLAVVNLDPAGKAAYSFYRAHVADRSTTAMALNALSDQASPTLVYTGCLALSPEDANKYLPWLAEQKETGRTVVIDVNVRLALIADVLAYMKNIQAALAYTDIVKVSDDDLDAMSPYFGLAGSSTDKAQQLMAQVNANILLLTVGSEGAYLLARGHATLQARAPRELRVVDTVGAGDSFFAGFLAYYLTQAPDLARALAHAVKCASITCTRQGCQPPTWDEVIAFKL